VTDRERRVISNFGCGIARSPHTTAPGVDHQPGDSRVYRKIRPEVERRIARAATLKENTRLLDTIEGFANTSSQLIDLNGETGDESSDMVDSDELKHLIKSLRTAQEQHP
jgi:hypothetical protein